MLFFQICVYEVFLNLTVAADEELFEDDPIDYIRRELEGSGKFRFHVFLVEADSRRRASADLVRGNLKLILGLLENFAKPVTELFSQYVATGFEVLKLLISRRMKKIK